MKSVFAIYRKSIGSDQVAIVETEEDAQLVCKEYNEKTAVGELFYQPIIVGDLRGIPSPSILVAVEMDEYRTSYFEVMHPDWKGTLAKALSEYWQMRPRQGDHFIVRSDCGPWNESRKYIHEMWRSDFIDGKLSFETVSIEELKEMATKLLPERMQNIDPLQPMPRVWGLLSSTGGRYEGPANYRGLGEPEQQTHWHVEATETIENGRLIHTNIRVYTWTPESLMDEVAPKAQKFGLDWVDERDRLFAAGEIYADQK